MFNSRVLELDKVRDRLATLTSFSAGRELALLLEPSADWSEVSRWQQGTADAIRLASLKPDLTMGGASDIRPLATRAALGGVLQPWDLTQVAALVRCARRWRAQVARLDALLPVMSDLAKTLGDHATVLAAITAAISDNAEVIDSASPELSRLRAAIRGRAEQIRSRMQEISARPDVRKALQEVLITERDGRPVLPVKAEFRGRVKGLVHDQSASGATLFIEPLEVVELSNQLRQLELAEQREVERILSSISRQVGADAVELEDSVQALARLDLQCAKARLAALMSATRPQLADVERRAPAEAVIRLIDARHPLLGREAVPLSLELGGEFDTLVITGPNTGGKTVALKTVGLLALMGQSGLYIPAGDGCLLSVFRSVRADIGDEQSIEQNLSTFSSHISHIVDLLGEVDDRSLVLLDEVGAGTDPREGSALAQSLLEHLRQRRVFCIATTHYTDLKLYAHTAPRVENASVEFDPVTLRPTYRLIIGIPGRSNALEIAERLGLSGVITERARAMLDQSAVQAGNLLEDLQREYQTARDTRVTADRVRADAERALQRLAAAEERESQRWQQTEEEARHSLAEFEREIDRLRSRVPEAVIDSAALAELRSAAASLPQPRPKRRRRAAVRTAAPAEILERLPLTLTVGKEILVPSLGQTGTISRLSDDGVEIDIRGLRVRLSRAQMAGAREPLPGESTAESTRLAGSTQVILAHARQEVSLQVDLRGQRRDDASAELDRYLNDAYLGGLRRVRVVHGRGSGAVRLAVQQMLEGHPLVSRFQPAARDAGGDGVTEVSLVD